MNDRLRLRQLRYFVEVARNASIGKAAEIFDISQPAVSSQIKDLERTLGVTLFTRSRSGVALTPYGEIFLQSATAVVGEMKEAAARLEAFRHSVAGLLTTPCPKATLAAAAVRLRLLGNTIELVANSVSF